MTTAGALPVTQPCAICRGPTEWDPDFGSYHCRACSGPDRRVCTAPSDGRQPSRGRPDR